MAPHARQRPLPCGGPCSRPSAQSIEVSSDLVSSGNRSIRTERPARTNACTHALDLAGEVNLGYAGPQVADYESPFRSEIGRIARLSDQAQQQRVFRAWSSLISFNWDWHKIKKGVAPFDHFSISSVSKSSAAMRFSPFPIAAIAAVSHDL